VWLRLLVGLDSPHFVSFNVVVWKFVVEWRISVKSRFRWTCLHCCCKYISIILLNSLTATFLLSFHCVKTIDAFCVQCIREASVWGWIEHGDGQCSAERKWNPSCLDADACPAFQDGVHHLHLRHQGTPNHHHHHHYSSGFMLGPGEGTALSPVFSQPSSHLCGDICFAPSWNLRPSHKWFTNATIVFTIC